MRTLRLWCDGLADKSESDIVELDKGEAHHFAQVLRGKVGEALELFDGHGHVAQSICCDFQAKKPLFKITELKRHSHLNKLVVMSPSPKGKRLPYMLEKLQECGVFAWVPLETEFSVRDKISDHQKEKLYDRLKDACKQSGCPWRMEIRDALSFKAALDLSPIYALDIGGKPWGEKMASQSETYLLLGPEAGWSDEERTLLSDHSIPRIGLSAYHLRMETAAVIGSARLLETI